ncbi:MAG: DMT family transporter [Spirochaetes bacterium]|nr:DMT family transporter [Spirochaetota bacterium]HOV46119.1 DMT family transporter [Exilispira sp.]
MESTKFKSKPKLTIYLYATFSMLFWGLSFVWVKIAYEYYRPITLVTIRLFVATIILAIFLIFRKPKVEIVAKDLPVFALLAFFEPFCYFLGESFGMQFVSSTLASVIIAMIPVIAPFFTFIFYREKLSLSGFLGLFISFSGVLFLIIDKNFKLVAELEGILLLFFAVFSSIGYSLIVKKLTLKYDSITIITMQNGFGFAYFLPFFLIFDFKHFITVTPDIRLITTILQLSIFASVLSFILFTSVIRQLGINTSNIFTNLIPLFTALFSFIILKEKFNFQKIAGILLVLLGVFASQIDLNSIFKRKKIKNQ